MGNIKADKEKFTEKIDGAIAAIMGLDRAIRCGNDLSASVYDERGIFIAVPFRLDSSAMIRLSAVPLAGNNSMDFPYAIF